jgi:uncharacterized protein (TIGR02594 family)
MTFLRSAIAALLLLFSTPVFAGEAVLNRASTYVGMHERSSRTTIKGITRVDPVRTPWCAAFVNGVLRSVGISGTGSNTARSFTKYKTGTTNPQKGDIVVLRRKGGSGAHVGIFKGFVTRNGRTMVAVVGGNQSNKVSVAYYPTSKVITYRRVA